MFTQDVQAEWFVSNQLCTLEDILVCQDVVNDLCTTFVGGEFSDSVLFKKSINQPTLCMKSGEAT